MWYNIQVNDYLGKNKQNIYFEKCPVTPSAMSACIFPQQTHNSKNRFSAAFGLRIFLLSKLQQNKAAKFDILNVVMQKFTKTNIRTKECV